MKRIAMLAPAYVAAQAILLGFVGAEETASQIKTGTVTNVVQTANQVVVMVARGTMGPLPRPAPGARRRGFRWGYRAG